MGIIRSLWEEGKTVLLVDQNAVIALNMTDRAHVLEIGLCTLEGEAKDILLNEHVIKAYSDIT